MAGELLERRAKCRQEQINPADAGTLELLDALLHRFGYPRSHVFPEPPLVRRVADWTRTAGKKDRAVGSGLVPDVQAAPGLGVDRPRRRDRETRFHQTRGERIPGAGRLVREHQRHDAFRLQDPTTLGEDRGHPLLVVLTGEGACTASDRRTWPDWRQPHSPCLSTAA